MAIAEYQDERKASQWLTLHVKNTYKEFKAEQAYKEFEVKNGLAK
jgi:hypothetical protein